MNDKILYEKTEKAADLLDFTIKKLEEINGDNDNEKSAGIEIIQSIIIAIKIFFKLGLLNEIKSEIDSIFTKTIRL